MKSLFSDWGIPLHETFTNSPFATSSGLTFKVAARANLVTIGWVKLMWFLKSRTSKITPSELLRLKYVRTGWPFFASELNKPRNKHETTTAHQDAMFPYDRVTWHMMTTMWLFFSGGWSLRAPGQGGLEGCQQALLSGELFSHGNGELARRCARKPVTQCQ